MAITNYDLTVKAPDLLGVAYSPTLAAVTAFIDTNLGDDEGIIDTINGEIRLGPYRQKCDSSGTAVFAGLIGSDSDPADLNLAPGSVLQYRVRLEYINAITRKRGQMWTSGWFELNADANLFSDIAFVDYAPVSWQSEFITQAQAYLDAQAAIAGIDDTDSAVAGLIENNLVGPLTNAALDATTAARVPSASTSTQGKVELATGAEAATGTDTARALTPSAAKVAFPSPAAKTTSTSTAAANLPFLNPKDFGVKADLRSFTTGAMTSGSAVLTITGYTSSTADIGKHVTVKEVGAAGATINTTVAGISGSNLTLATTASTTASGVDVILSTDDADAWDDLFRYAEENTSGIPNPRRILPPNGITGYSGTLEWSRRASFDGAGWGSSSLLFGHGFEFASNTLFYQLGGSDADGIRFRRATSGFDFIGPFQMSNFALISDASNTAGHGICGKALDGTQLSLQDGARFNNIMVGGFAEDGFHFPAGAVPGHFVDCLSYMNGEYGFTFGTRYTAGGVLHMSMFSGDQNGLGLLRLLGQSGAQGTYSIYTCKSEKKANIYRTGVGGQEYALVLEDMAGTHVQLYGAEHIASSPAESACPEGLIKILDSVPEITWHGAYVRVEGAQTSGATIYAGQPTTPVIINDTVNSRTVGGWVNSGSYGPGGLHDKAEAPIFLPATRFVASTGSPSLGVPVQAAVAWLLDTASDEGVAGIADVPSHWNAVAIDAHYYNAAASSGNVVWRGQALALGPGDNLNTALTSGGDLTIAASSTQYLETVSTLIASEAVTAGKKLHIRIRRLGATAGGTDSLPNDVGLLGVTIRRVA